MGVTKANSGSEYMFPIFTQYGHSHGRQQEPRKRTIIVGRRKDKDKIDLPKPKGLMQGGFIDETV